MAETGTRKSEAGLSSDYAIEVHAFDAGERLLTSTARFHSQRSFLLEEREILSDQDFSLLRESSTDAFSEEEIEQMRHEKQPLDTPEVLAEEEMPGAARSLLSLIDTDFSPMLREKLEGLILVAEGRCDEASAHFEVLNKKWGRDCQPRLYKERCSQP